MRDNTGSAVASTKYALELRPTAGADTLQAIYSPGNKLPSTKIRHLIPGVEDAFQERPVEELDDVNDHGQEVAVRSQAHRWGRFSLFSQAIYQQRPIQRGVACRHAPGGKGGG